MLQQPDLQLDEAVSIEALVFPPAAVADFVATKIQLALRVQGPDFGISDCALLKNVDQTPTNRKPRSHLSHSPILSKLEIKDSLVKLKVVFGDWMRAKGGIVFVGLADYSGLVVETHLKDKTMRMRSCCSLCAHRHHPHRRCLALNRFFNPKSSGVSRCILLQLQRTSGSDSSVTIPLKNILKSPPHHPNKRAEDEAPIIKHTITSTSHRYFCI